MKVEQQVDQEKRLNPFAFIGRIVVFAVVAFAVCAIAKPPVYGRVCDDCSCHNDGKLAGCSNHDELAESAKGSINKEN